jgi:prolyl-tRNA synthetase
VALGFDKDESIREDAELLYRELTEAGVEVLFDDRGLRPGVMFNDADLIGNPIRLTVSTRNQKEGMVEVSNRYSDEISHVARDSTVNHIKEEIKVLFDAL